MNLSGVTSKLTSHADKLGILAGYFSKGTGAVQDQVSRVLSGNLHVPDITGLGTAIANSAGLRSGVLAAIAGYAVQEFAPGSFGKYGKALSDLGIGYIEGTVLFEVIQSCVWSSMGSDPAQANFNPNWRTQIANAPTTQQAIAASYQY